MSVDFSFAKVVGVREEDLLEESLDLVHLNLIQEEQIMGTLAYYSLAQIALMNRDQYSGFHPLRMVLFYGLIGKSHCIH